jgi:hypothetical protein
MRKNVILVLSVLLVTANAAAQTNLWQTRLAATQQYMQHHLWNPTTGNFVRRADQPNAPGSDAWGITIVLDAYAWMVEGHAMKPLELKQYFQSSSMLYEKTDGISGARILARQSDQIYIGGDDDLQWCAALVHCFNATKDTDYLNAAKSDFNALIAMGFWQNGESKGWSWNSGDRRPNGVSTAYGALAAARLYAATHEEVYKQWANSSLEALKTPQVGFFPRDMVVAVNAACTLYDVTKEHGYIAMADDWAKLAIKQAKEVIAGKRKSECNPTDIADLAEGLDHLSCLATKTGYDKEASSLINFFTAHRTTKDIAEKGFFSRYDSKGNPILDGSYLGVPCNAPFLPEVAEMLKLFAIEAYCE